MLKFSQANSKIKKLATIETIKPFLEGNRKIYSFDILAGYTCPFARDCLSKVIGGKVYDGPRTHFRCYAASLEALYPSKFAADKHNTDLLVSKKTAAELASLIKDSMPKNLGVCRIHSSGDFFNQNYFDAWLAVAKDNPNRLFYGYTKNLPAWINRRQEVPPNMILTASYGGRRDDMIEDYNLRNATVIYYEQDAKAWGYEIDKDDSHAADPAKKHDNFLLLIHGVGPKGSVHAEAVRNQF